MWGRSTFCRRCYQMRKKEPATVRDGPNVERMPMRLWLWISRCIAALSRFGQDDGRHLLFANYIVVRRHVCAQQVLPFGQLFVELLAEHVKDLVRSLRGR